MKIQHVEISNFRNIKSACYDLGNTNRINIFTGPNRTGKTNTILAIYWCLADYLMDGSSDYASFKPINDRSAEVSVELTFDSFKLRKTYAENWVKTRGSSETRLAGHVTKFFIDDLEMTITEAKKDLAKRFGTEGKSQISKFDLLRAIIDPYYLARCDWKIARQFIVELVGDVRNEDVINANPKFDPIKARLKQDGWDIDKTKKFYKQQLAIGKEDIEKIQNQIAGLNLVKNVEDSDYKAASDSIKALEESQANLKATGQDLTALHQAEEKASSMALEINKLETAERADVNVANQQAYAAYQVRVEAAKRTWKSRDDAMGAFNKASAEVNQAKAELNQAEMDRDLSLQQLEDLRKRYADLYSKSEADAPAASTCPNCGFVLNQADIDAQRNESNRLLLECLNAGKAKKIESDNLVAVAAEKKLQFSICSDKVAAVKRVADNAANTADQLPAQPATILYQKSDKLNKMEEDLHLLRLQIEGLKKPDSTITEKLAELEAQKAAFTQVLDARTAYTGAQKQIENLDESLVRCQHDLMNLEEKLALVDSFINEKLNLFAEKISEVFGDKLKFVLIQTNIKEGSWEEVCYPTVVGKETPFLNGSGSEQIIAGIYIAECIKKKLGLEDLPYIFDECDKLDSESIAALDTNSQIITTKVNDVNYKTVTLVTR